MRSRCQVAPQRRGRRVLVFDLQESVVFASTQSIGATGGLALTQRAATSSPSHVGNARESSKKINERQTHCKAFFISAVFFFFVLAHTNPLLAQFGGQGGGVGGAQHDQSLKPRPRWLLFFLLFKEPHLRSKARQRCSTLCFLPAVTCLRRGSLPLLCQHVSRALGFRVSLR